MKPTPTATLASAMDILARDIESADGVANAAIREAADRLRELERERDEAREIIREASVKFCCDGPDGQIAAEMFRILGKLKEGAK